MNAKLRRLAVATACLACCQQATPALTQDPAAGQADESAEPKKPFVREFSITAIESGPFSISAIVEPATPQTAKLKPAGEPAPEPGPALQKQLEDFGKRLSEQLAEQQKKMVEELAQQQKILTEQMTRESQAAIKKIAADQAAQAQRVIAAQQAQSNRVIAAQQAQSQRVIDEANRVARAQAAQNDLLQARLSRLQNRQDYLAGTFMQMRQDELLNSLDRLMYTDPLLARSLNPYGRRDLLGSISDMLRSAAMTAQSLGGFANQRAQSSPEALAARVNSLLAEKLSQDAAQKVLSALNSGMSGAAAGSDQDQMRRFASLMDRLDTMLKGQTPGFSPDDYERLALLADGASDNQLRAQLLEMSMESCARIACDQSRNPIEKQRAKAYALLLRSQFEKVRDTVETGSPMLSRLDFDIDKCTRIGNGRDIFA